jgi:hypothetical protein
MSEVQESTSKLEEQIEIWKCKYMTEIRLNNEKEVYVKDLCSQLDKQKT